MYWSVPARYKVASLCEQTCAHHTLEKHTFRVSERDRGHCKLFHFILPDQCTAAALDEEWQHNYLREDTKARHVSKFWRTSIRCAAILIFAFFLRFIHLQQLQPATTQHRVLLLPIILHVEKKSYQCEYFSSRMPSSPGASREFPYMTWEDIGVRTWLIRTCTSSVLQYSLLKHSNFMRLII